MPSNPKPEKKPAKPVRTRAPRPVLNDAKIEKLTTDPDATSTVTVFGPNLDKHIVTVGVINSEDHVWGGRLSAVTGEEWTAQVTFPSEKKKKHRPVEDVSVTVINPTSGLPSKPKKVE
ncbi:MAG TPA: hypothetical protein VD866_07250 [Urbifossiella sp.]|nr:hypothetical protein [Urbifossiella sp.]